MIVLLVLIYRKSTAHRRIFCVIWLVQYFCVVACDGLVDSVYIQCSCIFFVKQFSIICIFTFYELNDSCEHVFPRLHYEIGFSSVYLYIRIVFLIKMRYAQIVMGPAGSGKSTYCSIMQQHAIDSKRTVDVVNLDPAAEYFDYKPLADIRELIQLDDAMDDEFNFGPNGGLVFCMEYLIENATWLTEELGDMDEDYIIFDCPGQIELYTHMTVIKQLITILQNLNFRICGVFLMDVQFMIDAPKFLSGTLAALSAMINLEIPHVNILSKMDLLSKSAQKRLDNYIEPDPHSLLTDAEEDPWNDRYRSLTESIGRIITDYSLVRFLPLNIKDEESVADTKLIIDNTIQYGEDMDVKVRDFDEQDNEVDESS